MITIKAMIDWIKKSHVKEWEDELRVCGYI